MASLHTLADHPLVADRLRILRDRETPQADFVRALEHLSYLLAAKATDHLRLATVTVTTPLEKTAAAQLSDPILLVPILRAGMGLLRGFEHLLPEARIAFFGAARDEKTLHPVIYLDKIPADIPPSTAVFLLDPMLATGHSALAAIDRLMSKGARWITLVSVLAAPEGIAAVHAVRPDVTIVTAAIDRHLNGHGYILPGLGDAGDRQFGC
ncbi:uracil phosphoribosyltransferase [Verrucomicrobium sp. GAS474]|uniref:uracil phosphoribosyltransferase n=1 Tax=Verrucomicrobium sp. GAS474 TaxID=1882831 RepID=UPI0008799677|nr:uracil phosphoribosyltransferase [Verrucomicrobium sp. GAS474]SDT85882.1 uracil phosphoribosyltransferase [Verrucomicrobium sp. GAS474]